jgi:hypothetical protein
MSNPALKVTYPSRISTNTGPLKNIAVNDELGNNSS